MKKKRRILQWMAVMIDFFIILFLSLFVLNVALREEIPLREEHRKALLQLFPEKHIEEITLYKGGIYTIGSTMAIGNSVYFKEHDEHDRGKNFLENPLSDDAVLHLVHEITHTYQKGFLFGDRSMLMQFKSFWNTGTRDGAYLYPLPGSPNPYGLDGGYNSEQEATLIEDYYCLKFLPSCNISRSYCIDCSSDREKRGVEPCFFCADVYTKEEMVEKIEPIEMEILRRHEK